MGLIMKIVIAILIVLMAFLGFQVYGIVTEEIEEAQISSIQTINKSKVKTITVDKAVELNSYTHRVSTYEQVSTDLVSAASLYLMNLDSRKYITVFYFVNDQLIQEEFDVMRELIALEPLHKELLIVLPDDGVLKTNLDKKEITFYKIESLHVIHVEPKKTGHYKISFNDTTITFENLEEK